MPNTAIDEPNLISGKYTNGHPEMIVLIAHHDVLDLEPQPKK